VEEVTEAPCATLHTGQSARCQVVGVGVWIAGANGRRHWRWQPAFWPQTASPQPPATRREKDGDSTWRLRRTAFVQHAACGMLYAACSMQYAACSMPHGAIRSRSGGGKRRLLRQTRRAKPVALAACIPTARRRPPGAGRRAPAARRETHVEPNREAGSQGKCPMSQVRYHMSHITYHVTPAQASTAPHVPTFARSRVLEHGTRDTEHEARSTEHGTRSAEHGTRSAGHGTRKAESGRRKADLPLRMADPGTLPHAAVTWSANSLFPTPVNAHAQPLAVPIWHPHRRCDGRSS
jgi:hypothetical protein